MDTLIYIVAMTALSISNPGTVKPPSDGLDQYQFLSKRFVLIEQQKHTTELNKRWQREALIFNTLCPNGHYDRARDVDVCE